MKVQMLQGFGAKWIDPARVTVKGDEEIEEDDDDARIKGQTNY